MTKVFKSSYRVYYEDTDAQGIVYHANHLKFFERGRSDYLRSANVHQTKLKEESGIVFVLRRCELDYKSPIKLDDLVTVETKITKIGRTSIEMEQRMVNENDIVLAEAKMFIVCVGPDLRPIKVPQEIIDMVI